MGPEVEEDWNPRSRESQEEGDTAGLSQRGLYTSRRRIPAVRKEIYVLSLTHIFLFYTLDSTFSGDRAKAQLFNLSVFI